MSASGKACRHTYLFIQRHQIHQRRTSRWDPRTARRLPSLIAEEFLGKANPSTDQKYRLFKNYAVTPRVLRLQDPECVRNLRGRLRNSANRTAAEPRLRTAVSHTDFRAAIDPEKRFRCASTVLSHESYDTPVFPLPQSPSLQLFPSKQSQPPSSSMSQTQPTRRHCRSSKPSQRRRPSQIEIDDISPKAAN